VAREKGYDVQLGTRVKNVAKSRFFVTKCRFTRRLATLGSKQKFDHTSAPQLESPMSRRYLTLLVVAVASMVITACGTSPTAPRQDDEIVTNGSGG
jgi:hypothetical protein